MMDDQRRIVGWEHDDRAGRFEKPLTIEANGIQTRAEFVPSQKPVPPFRGGFVTTQFFGARPEYYRRFGFAGHEGMDFMPLAVNDAPSDPTVFAVEQGIVTAIDWKQTSAYGLFVAVWNEAARRKWYYCHLASTPLQVGTRLERGDPIGIMGETGNAQGKHLHLGLRLTWAEHWRYFNMENGYRGFIDPHPTLEGLRDQESRKTDIGQ